MSKHSIRLQGPVLEFQRKSIKAKQTSPSRSMVHYAAPAGIYVTDE